jgi:entericidin B
MDAGHSKEIDMKNWVAVLTLLCAGGVMAGCNTFQGAGKDIERGGEKIQDTAKDVQRKM